MKKNSVLYHILGLFLFPVFCTSMFSVVYSVATLNYEYLPDWMDGLSVFFYNLSAYCCDFAMFFAIGGFAYAISEKKTVPSVLCAVTAIFHGFLLPLLQFFVRAIFLVSAATEAIMQEYWLSDVIMSMSSTVKAVIALIVCVLTFAFFKITKRESRFGRPYIAPFSIPSVAAIIITGALIVFALFNFALGGEYGAAMVRALIVEIVMTLVNYAFIFFGARAEKHFIGNQTTEKSV